LSAVVILPPCSIWNLCRRAGLVMAILQTRKKHLADVLFRNGRRTVLQAEEFELHRRRWYVLAVLSIGTFMTPFDASIVAVAIPAMSTDLLLSYSGALWAQVAYLLATSALLIPAGRMADSRGPVRYNLLGTAVFALGSIIAGLAPNGLLLILGRCIQGAGGAFMFSTATGIVTAVFSSAERGRVIGLSLTASYLGLMAGPLLGGLIVTQLDWRWIFFINVPIAMATLIAGWALIGSERRDGVEARARNTKFPTASRGGRADWLGAVLLGALLAAAFVPLTFAPFWGWGSARTIGSLITAAALLVVFIIREHRVREPMLDLDLLRKNRVFSAACSAAFINATAVMAVVTLTAVFMEVVEGRSPQEAGLILLVQPAFMVLVSPFAGRLSDRIGSRPLACAGPVVIASGMTQLAFSSRSAGLLIPGLAMCGAGLALFSPPNMSAIMGSVGRSQLSLASGFQATMRFGGQGFSIAVLGSIAAWKLGSRGAGVIFLGETTSPTAAAAFGEGFRAAMLVGAALALCAAMASWFARPATVANSHG
jgi:EmrB/QacA subfamily drug resistance transporter